VLTVNGYFARYLRRAKILILKICGCIPGSRTNYPIYGRTLMKGNMNEISR